MKLGTITSRFNPEQIVYLKVDPEQCGMVTGILVRPGHSLSYLVTWADHEEASHQECELTDEKTFTQ